MPRNELHRLIRLCSTDCDGTDFLTSELSPSGMDVDGAYQLSLQTNLGGAAVHAYIDQGGHLGRNPAEIVFDVAPHLGPDEVKAKTAAVVGTKLEILTECVGQELPDGSLWPRPSDGFPEFWGVIDEAKADGMPIGTAVVSNGHTRLIQKFFEVHGLTQPDIFITHEVIEGLALNLPMEQQVKPAPLSINLAENLWSHMVENNGANRKPVFTVHVGDDPIKDGDLARNANVPFIHLVPEYSRESWQDAAALLGLGTIEFVRPAI